MPDRMNELIRYIFVYHRHLLTPYESAAADSFLAQAKARSASRFGRSAETMLQVAEEMKTLASKDPVVKTLLDRGPDEFYSSVSLRLLRDHRGEIKLNLCPRCLALCKTPRAKQRPKCYYNSRSKGH